jgi:hypothetical protein
MNHVTQAEFARLMGVNRSTVHRWLENGRMQAELSGLIDPEAGKRMLEATESPLPHHQARKAQFTEARLGDDTRNDDKPEFNPSTGSATPPATGGNNPSSRTQAENIGTALKLETYKLQKAKAELANMEVDKQAGLLVERAEVDYVLADFGNTLRGLLEGLPDRLAPAISRHRGDVNAIHAELESTAADLLREISEQMKRKMEEFT